MIILCLVLEKNITKIDLGSKNQFWSLLVGQFSVTGAVPGNTRSRPASLGHDRGSLGQGQVVIHFPRPRPRNTGQAQVTTSKFFSTTEHSRPSPATTWSLPRTTEPHLVTDDQPPPATGSHCIDDRWPSPAAADHRWPPPSTDFPANFRPLSSWPPATTAAGVPIFATSSVSRSDSRSETRFAIWLSFLELVSWIAYDSGIRLTIC